MVTSETVTNSQFIYTASDERIATYALGTWTWTIRDLANHPLREFTSSDTSTTWGTANLMWTRDHVWRGNALLASEARTSAADATIVTEHFHLDQLGTPRLVTNGNGGKVGVHSYYPFGGEIDLNPFEAPESQLKFTSHSRDTGRGGGLSLDYMHARSYTSTLGRFLSADPVLGRLRAPQSWNRYAYAMNRPLVFVDPTGAETNCVPIVDDKGVTKLKCTESEPMATAVAGVTDTDVQDNPNDDYRARESKALFWQWFLEAQKRIIVYGPNDYHTWDMRRTYGVQKLRQDYEDRGCTSSALTSQSLFPEGYSTFDAAMETALDGNVLMNTTQAQVGGFSARMDNLGNGQVMFGIANGLDFIHSSIIFRCQVPWAPKPEVDRYRSWAA